ncbi:MAG: hypothetical protein DSY70_07135 [Desulfobulbus sp.]|nr:MAG: hypothetical protein DSY70_07135 [Desulfobulbus sp.]
MKKQQQQELESFLDQWQETSGKTKEVFVHFKACLSEKEGVALDFVSRPGVTYSLRASSFNQKDKSVFVMVDVIEDSPRWLSICFYEKMVTDPEKRGDSVPGGLQGENAVCFDLEERDETLIDYIEIRLDEAWNAAGDGV